jgi:hypothetical protein
MRALREWRFEPARLKAATELDGRMLSAGTPVPVFLTVAIPVGE